MLVHAFVVTTVCMKYVEQTPRQCSAKDDDTVELYFLSVP